jgi:Rrf2 family protein
MLLSGGTMKLSTRARYALRMMLDVARHGGHDAPVPLAAVAARTDLSRGYLEQLATGLRKARLLRGVPGRKGGYRLARAASEIAVGDVIEASIGPVCIVDCVDDPSICVRAAHCECRILYALVNGRILSELRSHSLADLMDQGWLVQHGGSVEPWSGATDPCTAGSQPRRGRPRTKPRKVATERPAKTKRKPG